MDSKSTYKHNINNNANRDNVTRIAVNECSLISDYSQQMPTNNTHGFARTSFYLSFFFSWIHLRVSTLEYILFFEPEIRSKQYASDKTQISDQKTRSI